MDNISKKKPKQGLKVDNARKLFKFIGSVGSKTFSFKYVTLE